MRIANCAKYARSAAIVAVFAAVSQGAVWRQQEELPDARQIVDKFVEAVGGEDLIRSLTGQYMTGRMDVPAQGIGGDLEVWAAAPDKFLLKIEIPGLGAISSGYNGDVGWSINPAMGPMILEGRQLDQMRQQADFYSTLHPENLIASMETVEQTDFEGHSCYKVKVTTTWGEEYFEYFDTESGLMIGGERTQSSPMGEIPTTSVLSDYKDFGGVLVATKTVQRMMGVEQVITVSSLQTWEPDDAMFELPPEIKALTEGTEQQ